MSILCLRKRGGYEYHSHAGSAILSLDCILWLRQEVNAVLQQFEEGFVCYVHMSSTCFLLCLLPGSFRPLPRCHGEKEDTRAAATSPPNVCSWKCMILDQSPVLPQYCSSVAPGLSQYCSSIAPVLLQYCPSNALVLATFLNFLSTLAPWSQLPP